MMARASILLLLGWTHVTGVACAQDRWTDHLVGPRAASELDHPEMEVRLRAVETLASRGERIRAVAVLLEHLDVEEDPRVRRALIDALCRRGDPTAIGRLAAHLSDFGREDRAAILRAIGAIGGDAAIPVLIEWLGAADVGDVAVEALGALGAPAVPHLLAALSTPVAAPRAARALGEIGDARATGPLVVALGTAEPEARVALIDALGRLADERASAALAARLDDPEPAVTAAALRALRRVGAVDRADAVAARLDDGEPAVVAEALRTLMVLDPARAAPRLEGLLADPAAPALLRQVAHEGIYATPDVAFVPVLRRLLDDPTQRGRAADALSRLPDARGLAALLEAPDDPLLHVPIALSLRRGGGPGDLRARAHALLRADRSERGMVIAALARDHAALASLRDGLRADDPSVRASAAAGLWLIGEDAAPLAATVGERLMTESDPLVFRALALAALELRAPVDPARIDMRWWDPDTAPEALMVTAQNLPRAAARTRRRARRALRRSLRAPEPRVRAGAALALAIAHERGAFRALAALLWDEHDMVRLAAARALGVLSVPESSSSLSGRLRVEDDARVRLSLSTALEWIAGARPPGAFARGGEVLYARVITARGVTERAGPVSVDVFLDDGRWLRIGALEDGEVLVPDLPAGDVEVQVRLER